MVQTAADGAFASAAEIGIVSADPERMAAFYREVFGFAEVSSFAAAAGSVYKLRRGEARLKIFAPVDSPETNRLEPLGRREGICYLALYIGDIGASFDWAVEAGAEVMTAPMSDRPGAVVAVIRDPGGNIVELLQDPAGAGPG